MARRRAHASQAQARARVEPEIMPVSARVAWTYLASFIAVVGAGGLMIAANQTVAVAACSSAGDGLADCKFSWLIWSAMIGFLICLIPAAKALKLDWWLVGAMWSGTGLLVWLDAIEQWWWWLIALLLPAGAALVSANWERGQRWRQVQIGLLVFFDLIAVAALAVWYFKG